VGLKGKFQLAKIQINTVSAAAGAAVIYVFLFFLFKIVSSV
jgi:hypothetical protein